MIIYYLSIYPAHASHLSILLMLLIYLSCSCFSSIYLAHASHLSILLMLLIYLSIFSHKCKWFVYLLHQYKIHVQCLS